MTKKQSISQSFEELEKITATFEKGDIDLEKSIPQFKRGLELAKELKGKLQEIENQIEEINVSFDNASE